MKHFGDITKISGYDAPVVDIITGGSPCQDLSVAGKRAGLAGERSGLFMEQVRIIKEMREKDARAGRTGWAVRPRYMVWENVPGAFSSGTPKGADFAAVIEELIKVAEPDAAVHVCIPDRGWSKSGCYYAEDGSWSIAWRLHDAQFWGVPQRRKRIALVADFGGLSAPEILFERKGVSRDSEPGGAQRQGTAAGTEGGAGSAICLQGNGIDRADTAGCNGRGWCEDVSYTLNTIDRPAVYPPVANTLSARYDGSPQPDKGNGANIVAFAQNTRDEVRDLHDVAGCLAAETGMKQQTYVVGFKAGQGAKAGGIGAQEECAPTLSAVASGTNQVPAVMAFAQNQVGEVRVSPMSGTLNTNSNASGRNSPLVYDARGNGDGEIAPTMTGDHQDRVPAVFENHSQDSRYNPLGDTCETVSAKYGTGGNNMPMVVEPQTYQKVCGTIDCGIAKGTGNQLASQDMFVTNKSQVRRLTPMECERLQGYPDGWTDIGEWTDSKGKKHKDADSPRYKALGNSIALPFWAWLARRICAQYERTATMASLFDGIGGFPLVFMRAGAVPVWASEIEEFCVAVTKERFGDK